ncbi:hypothetical protein [Mesorhizobium sp. LSHC414A00]|uniref:hypothetical protein n=1 Tax=Mesorhizobium sp. LSHC414A00 TaxID=1287287 RepID=UPI00041378AB|nr:hypothetical protein [Mesorhizobium sp. LSHC414A00]
MAAIAAGAICLGGASAQQQTATTTQQADAKAALFTFVRAKTGDDATVAKYCRLAKHNPELFKNDDATRIVSTCIAAGISIYY